MFCQYIQTKHDLGDQFVYYDIYLVRINSKQIIQFLRDLATAMKTIPVDPVDPVDRPSPVDDSQASNQDGTPTAGGPTCSHMCQQVVESLVMDYKTLVYIMRKNWNHKMNTVRKQLDSSLSPLETTEAVLVGLMGDIYRYLHEFNNKPETYATSQQYYERALSYINDGLNRVPYALQLSNSDEDIYGIFLNYAVLCHESTNTHEALVLCTEAVELFNEFTPDPPDPTPPDLAVIALIKFNQKNWRPTEKPTATSSIVVES